MFDITPRLLIDLTEKGLVVADVDEGGKGKIRQYSEANLFYVALYKELAEMQVPYRNIKAIARSIKRKRKGYLVFNSNKPIVVTKLTLPKYIKGASIVVDLTDLDKKVKQCVKNGEY